MDEQTTTEAPVADGGQVIQGVAVDDQGLAIPQPEETETAKAVEETSEETSQEPETKVEEPSTEDNSLAKFFKDKGIDPKSPEALEKVAEMAINAEKVMHSKAQKASELEKALDTGITEEAAAQGLSDDERLDIVRIKTKLGVREFFDNNPEAKPYEQAMIQELTTKPHLAGDLESLYANAVVRSGKLQSQGRKEALESLAHKQTAAVPKGNAVTSDLSAGSAITPQNVDQMVSQMSVEEYRKRLPEINAAMAV